ncbi:heparinase II/III family protein [Pedobacter frigoris]|uniref:heparinase II/III domain-containing protein n=1 Tax=Pedobacter frigoris TaxID=2571272 RepID=UPI0029304100|nr:heparinase II/III family protein [Pedobacter frigoris]
MKLIKSSLLLFMVILITAVTPVLAFQNQPTSLADTVVTATWIKANLRKNGPHLILTDESLAEIKSAVVKDDALKAYYQFLYKNAEALLTIPVLERKLEGRRLLSVSREAVKRIGTLSSVYAISKEPRFLNRAEAELLNVCGYSDWNPSHFLDVGEMAYAVSIGLDWTLGDLPQSTREIVRAALINKALNPSLKENPKGWISGTNNWNQVCHGGMVAAAVAVADQEPELSAQIISRALKNIPRALKAYAPDGAYPEGASYWAYGTTYTLITISALESAFGTDFGIAQSPGFVQSALFVKKLAGPSGLYYNYFDSGSGGNNNLENQELLSWFAHKSGNAVYFDKNQLKDLVGQSDTDGKNTSKLNGAALVWMVKSKETSRKELPVNYKGDGVNPVVIFGAASKDKSGFYLGAKGGAANLSHGNMDAGSFVFELNGVRWSVDLGMQNYLELENVIGVNGLWNSAQGSPRWTLLSKNNFGHSTLTINEQLHNASGFAPLIQFKDSKNNPEASFDLTAVFKGQLSAATRNFKRKDAQTFVVEDLLKLSDQTQSITWAMMTQADAEVIEGGVLLKQNGKSLKVMIKDLKNVETKIVSKDPPPLEYDMKVEGLKRLEFRIPAKAFKNSEARIIVELTGV